MSKPFRVPSLAYLEFANIFTGSCGDFNFKLFPNKGEQTVRAVVWKGPLCFDKSEPLAETTFPTTEDGWQAGQSWLFEEYRLLTQQSKE